MSLCILIPAYNEGENLKILLPELKKLNLDIVVVDDGSRDDTAQIVREAGVALLRHERNYGKGRALQTGFNFILERGYQAVITMDADRQHDVADIPKFMEAYQSQKADILLGDRMRAAGPMPWLRLWTNKITSRIISILTGCRLKDTQSGFRLIRRNILEDVKLSTSRFDTESEILIKAIRKGFRVGSVPVRTIYFQDSQSKIKPWVDTGRFFKLIFRMVFIWRN